MSATSAAAELAELRDAVAARMDGTCDFLCRLVAAPSVLGNEESAQVVVEERLRALGFSVRSVEPDAERLAALPESGLPPLPYAGRRVLIGELPGSGEGVLLLNGHVDVVPAEPPALWAADPYQPVVRDGRLYGRGAADMKGGVAAMLLAVEAASSLGPLPAKIVYHSVIEEECTGNGALMASLAGPPADVVLIAEPTGGDLHLAGIGVIYARITVTGRSGHAETTDRLPQPIEEMHEIVRALRALEDELNALPPDPAFCDFERPYLLNVGALHSGDWPATTPPNAVLDVRLGFPDHVGASAAQQMLATAVQRVSTQADVAFWGHRAVGYDFDRDSPFVRLLRECHAEHHGAEPAAMAVRLTTDLRHYHRPFKVKGAACYGPVGGGVHGIDEWVDLASIADIATVVGLLLRRWSDG